MRKTLLFTLLFLTTLIRAQADCVDALGVCGNSSINYEPRGIGSINEPVGGCLSGENNSVWYRFTIATSGTLTFDIIPVDPNADYDWAVYGPNSNCANFGAPIRCNAATVVGVGANTGLNMTSTILSAAGGSTTPYCRYLDVLAGETYYLYIDNWINTANPTMSAFTLNWGGTATLSSPFTDPNIQPRPFLPPGSPAVNPNDPREVVICSSPAIFDFTTLSAGILNSNPNFTVSYHNTQNDAITGQNPITTPISVVVNSVYYYSIKYTDPTNPNNPINLCRQTGSFKFVSGEIAGNNATLFACNNNNSAVGLFDLSQANVIGIPNVTKKYYENMQDLNAGINEIQNYAYYTSPEATVYVKIISDMGCSTVAQINLKFHPVVVLNDNYLKTCFIEDNTSYGLFDLTLANVTTNTTITKKYYPSLTDAVNGTNEILNFDNYVAPSGVVYVKGFNTQGCYDIAEVTLEVIPPVYSPEIKDLTICAENTVNIDAGDGFTSYLWSNGDTTQTTTLGIGKHWVKLNTRGCITKQEFTIYAAEKPVVQTIDISNNTVTVNIVGGKAPYQYSLDNIHWQDSNVFTGLTRGNF